MIAQNQTVVFQEKNIHQQPITGISASKQDEHLFLTISEDQTMRLYDLRLNSSVRLFNMGMKSDSQTANCLLGENNVYGARDDEILLFDIRQEIIVKNCTKKWGNGFEINQISFDPTQQSISTNLDSGNTCILDRDLQIKSQLKGAHENICFSGDFIQKDEQLLYISTGFDYKIVLWDYQDKEDAQVLFKFDLSSIYNYVGKMHEFYAPLTVSPPVIYSAVSKDNSILISTETGQVYNFKVNSLKKRKNKSDPTPEFVIDAHQSKVMRSTYLNDKIVTISNDMTFAIWDKNKENLRAKIKNKPNWIETIGKNTILVGDVSNKLSIYEIV